MTATALSPAQRARDEAIAAARRALHEAEHAYDLAQDTYEEAILTAWAYYDAKTTTS